MEKPMLDHIKKFRLIMKNYMEMNYSRKFIQSGKYHLVNSSVTPEKATGVFIRCTGDSFKVYFDLKNRTIHRQGPYGNHRGTSVDRIFGNAKVEL